jgi:hypothetical protein
VLVEAGFKKIDIVSCNYMGGKGVPNFYNADRKKIKMGIIFRNGDRKSKWVAAQVCCSGESEEIFV